jgi:hypothetical protein
VNHILASVDSITASQALGYAAGIVGSLFGIIILLLGLVYNQVQKVLDLMRQQMDRQDEAHRTQVKILDAKVDSCRVRDEQSHSNFHVALESLRTRMVRLETRLDIDERTLV